MVTIYNSAGEVVKHLFSGPSQALSSNFTISNSAILQGGPGVSLEFGAVIQGGGNSLIWLGTNDGGQFVSAGSYTIQVQTTDPFGAVQSWTRSITVLPQSSSQSLVIYNSAGELVATLNPSEFTSKSVTNIGFGSSSKSAFVLGSGGGVQFQMQDSSGNQVLGTWNGKSNSGQMVAPGSYILQLVNNNEGNLVVQSKGFVVLGDISQSSFSILAGPNPVGPMDKELVFNIVGVQSGQTASIQLYNLAGELVSQAAGVSGGSRIVMKLGNWSSGIYVAVAELSSGLEVLSRKSVKVAIAR